MEVKQVKAIMLMCLAVLTGCATHGNTVRCDGRLEPINSPTPRAMASGAELDESEVGRE